jgi:hypothetical protein
MCIARSDREVHKMSGAGYRITVHLNMWVHKMNGAGCMEEGVCVRVQRASLGGIAYAS